MFVRAVFWISLSIAFGGLAFVSWRERQKFGDSVLGGRWRENAWIPAGADTLVHILRVESIGFVLAAIAALYEVFS